MAGDVHPAALSRAAAQRACGVGVVMSNPSREQWASALAGIRRDGVSTGAVRLVADGLGVSERTVWRRLNAGPSTSPVIRTWGAYGGEWIEHDGRIAIARLRNHLVPVQHGVPDPERRGFKSLASFAWALPAINDRSQET